MMKFEFYNLLKKFKIHYAWVVLVSAMVLSAIGAAGRHSFGVFVDPLVKIHGWSHGEVSLAYSIAFGSAFIVSLLFGTVAERFGARRIILLGIAGITVGLVLTGTVTSLSQLYLYYGVIFGGFGFLLNVVIPVTITRWFAKKSGLAIGLMWASLGMGGMVGPIAFRWYITARGWQAAFFTAGFIFCCIMLLALWFFRNRPQDLHMEPYGDNALPDKGGNISHMDFAVIRKSFTFWSLICTHFLGCVGHSILLTHIVSIAIFKGIPGLTASAVLSVIAATSIFSRFIASIMADKYGGKNTLAAAFVMQSIPVLFLIPSTESRHFFTIAFFFGLGYGGEMPSFPIINKQYWGDSSPLSAIYSWQLAGALSGMGIGGWIGGVLFDTTGLYSWSIIASFLFSATGLVPIMMLPQCKKRVENS